VINKYDIIYPTPDITHISAIDNMDGLVKYIIHPINAVVTMNITMPIIILIYFFIYMV